MAIPTLSNIRGLPALAFGGDLIGREAELVMISEWRDDPCRRLLTITGPGGVGKTHLAYRALQDAAEPFQTSFVSLAPISGSDLIYSAIGHAMGLDERAGAPLLDLIAGSVADRPAIIALDNLEHLPGAATILAELLEALPGVKVLATSRAPLHLRAEELLVLESLPVPETGVDRSPEEIARIAAVQLFLQRVQRIDRGFELTPGNAGHIVEICRRLEGLPLAIELISSRAGALSLTAMLERMDDQLALLQARKPDAPRRQWSMQASIAWSLDLLSMKDRMGLQRLAVFPGAFGADDALTVAGVPLESLELLSRHHLMLKRREPAAGRAFQLSEPIKQYCLDVLRAIDEEEQFRDRHADAVARLVEQNQAQLVTDARTEALATLDSRMDDINAALRWTLTRNDLATTIRIATGMQHGWAVVVHWSVGLGWLREIIAAVDRSGFDDDAAISGLLLTAGLVALHAEQYEESSQLFDRAVRLARNSGERNLLIDALIRSIPTLIELRQLDEGELLSEEAMRLIDETTPPKSVQMASTQLGLLSLHRGNHEQALVAFQPGLARARSLGNAISLAFHLRVIGEALYGLGHYEASREFYLAVIEAQAAERTTHYYLATLGLVRLELAASRLSQAARLLTDYLDGRHARRESKRAREGLFEAAHLAHLDGNAEKVAQFLGAASSGPRGYLPAGGQDALEHVLTAAAKQSLGQDRFNALYRRGQSISLTQSIEEAISYADEVAGQLEDTPATEPKTLATTFQLTDREIQVLQCLVEGKTDREIGDTLYISHATASTHVRNILRKLDAPSRSIAMVTAVRYGIVSFPQ